MHAHSDRVYCGGLQLVDDNAAECAHVHLQVRGHAVPLDMRAAPQSRVLLRMHLPLLLPASSVVRSRLAGGRERGKGGGKASGAHMSSWSRAAAAAGARDAHAQGPRGMDEDAAGGRVAPRAPAGGGHS